VHDANERQHLEWLLQVIVSTELGGLDGGFDGAVRSHQHHRQARLSFVKLPHQVQTADAGQAQVGQYHFAFVFAGAAQTFIATVATR